MASLEIRKKYPQKMFSRKSKRKECIMGSKMRGCKNQNIKTEDINTQTH